MEGWIKLHRKLQNNPLWTCEPFTRGQAWIDLLILANHEDGFFYLREHKINVKRGQVGWSVLRLSKRWQWSRSKVNKFIKDLEKEQQVKQQKSKSTSIITILNYNLYQEKEQQVEQQQNNSKTTARQQQDTNKNDKNDKNDKKLYISDIEFFKNEILNSERIAHFGISLKAECGFKTTTEIIKEKFNTFCIIQNPTMKGRDREEFLNHFYNWLKIDLRKAEKENPIKKQSINEKWKDYKKK